MNFRASWAGLSNGLTRSESAQRLGSGVEWDEPGGPQERRVRQAGEANQSILLAFEPIQRITTVGISQYPY